jgi:cytochrome c peroxidase
MRFRILLGIFIAGIAALCSVPILVASDGLGPLSPAVLNEIARVEAEIDGIEADTLKRLVSVPDNQVQQIELLGKLMLFDKELSVNHNEACAFCHMPATGFTGPISELNRTTGSYPGSVRTRFSERKPQTHTYAPLAPVLHYNENQGDLVGGNFWDMRATGRRLGNPAAEQAEGPPVNPTEMGLPDIACSVYRASQRPYRGLFEAVWGAQAFAIDWPVNVGQVCNTPGPPPASDPAPVHLSAVDRGRAAATFDQMAQSIAGYEASHEVTAFSSKYDAVLAGKAQFTPPEQQGYEIFRGKGRCNECHRGSHDVAWAPTSRKPRDGHTEPMPDPPTVTMHMRSPGAEPRRGRRRANRSGPRATARQATCLLRATRGAATKDESSACRRRHERRDGRSSAGMCITNSVSLNHSSTFHRCEANK